MKVKSRETTLKSVQGAGEEGREILGSSGGVILETNQWLIHSWGLAGLELFLLGCLLAGSCPEECTGACLWKAEAMTSSSLTAAQSGNCLSLKKRGMEQECRKKSITLSFPPCSLVLVFLSHSLLQPIALPFLYITHSFLSFSSHFLPSFSCCVSLCAHIFDQEKGVSRTSK